MKRFWLVLVALAMFSVPLAAKKPGPPRPSPDDLVAPPWDDIICLDFISEWPGCPPFPPPFDEI